MMGFGKFAWLGLAAVTAGLLGLAACGGNAAPGVVNPYGAVGSCGSAASGPNMQSVTGQLWLQQGPPIPQQGNNFTLVLTQSGQQQFGVQSPPIGSFCMNWVDAPYLFQTATQTNMLTANSQAAGGLGTINVLGPQIFSLMMSLQGMMPLPAQAGYQYGSGNATVTVNIGGPQGGDLIQGNQLQGQIAITAAGRQFIYATAQSQGGYGH